MDPESGSGDGPTQDRTELWLPLMRQLTEEFPGWAVWKNAASAFAGTGDIDSFAPPDVWPSIQDRFTTWVRSQSALGPVIICRHIPQGPHFIALQEGSPYLVQLDVKERGTFRGSTLIDAWDLRELTVIDALGFRRVRAGVEGVIKLCMNGVLPWGRPNDEGLVGKRVADLLAADAEGVDAAAALFGPAAGALRRGAAAVTGGGWDRSAMRLVEGWCLARALGEPRTAISRLHFVHRVAPRCVVVSLIRDRGRRVPDDRERWLDEVARNHEVLPGR
jgi:hypothetical protein